MALKTSKKPARAAGAKRTTTGRPTTVTRRSRTRTIIKPKELPPSSVPLSHAVKVGNLVFVSGSTPFAPDGSIAKGDFGAQMRQVMENIKVILKDAGSSLERVVKVNVILIRISDFWAMNDIYKTYFRAGNYPARTTVEAPLAHPDFLLEIECIAEA